MDIIKNILCVLAVLVGLTSHSTVRAANEANRLEIAQDLKIIKGTAEFELPIVLINKVALMGFQLDLYLPEGFKVAKDEYGECLIEMARTTTSRHSISSKELSNGAVRILCSSATNATFSGNSGVVIKVTITVDESVATGDYVFNLKNIVMSDPKATRYTCEDVLGKIIVTDAINVKTGDANGDGVVDVADVVAIVNYILEKPADNFNKAAADVNKDNVIDAADVVLVVNIILDKGNVNAARVREVLRENGFII